MLDYSKKGHYYTDGPRDEVVHLCDLLTRGSSVLDIGAGYGNNTKFLLQKGCAVTALETNPDAIASLRLLDTSGHLHVAPHSVDIFKPRRHYDAAVCCMVLHFLENKDVGMRVIKDIQTWTKPGGLNVITSYLDCNDLTNDYSFLLQAGELPEVYKDWEIIQYTESYARTLGNAKGLKDIVRILQGQRGYKSARILARKPRDIK